MPTDTARHPVAGVVARVHAELDTIADAAMWSMGPVEAGDTLESLTRLVARVTEVQLRVAVAADTAGVGDATGATSAASWWAHRTRTTRVEAHRLMRLGKSLDTSCGATRVAFAAGDVLADQAMVIVKAIGDLPEDLVDADLVAEVEAYLVEKAGEYDAAGLRVLANRALQVIAPEIGEAHEQAVLEKEERDARAAARLTLSFDGHGKAHGRFTLPEAQGQMFKKQLQALAAPKANPGANAGPGSDPTSDQPSEGEGERRPLPERMGWAFMDWIERYPTTRLPTAGGMSATMTVTIALDALVTGLGTAVLETGTVVTASQARRWACEAGMIPVVLGGQSQVLDLGRKGRFHTEVQRIAIATRDKTCTVVGCDWPPHLCHIHHDDPWSHGGDTTVEGGRLLCPHHHRRVHDPVYETTHHPDGKISFTRRH